MGQVSENWIKLANKQGDAMRNRGWVNKQNRDIAAYIIGKPFGWVMNQLLIRGRLPTDLMWPSTKGLVEAGKLLYMKGI